ncbi:MAG: glycosyl hydrolase family 65 protein [Microbacterium sp.]|nr:glycosyl hydrolase family 65 protein [Microbacterium sp.]
MKHKPAAIDSKRYLVDPWRLIETRADVDDGGLAESLFAVGNGYLGLRGNFEEGRTAYEHGTFINGLHETWPIAHAERAYGFAEVGQTIVNAPDTKTIRLYVDDEPLSISSADLLDYRRELDFRTGVLYRTLLWLTPAGKRVRVESERMVSFEERHLAIHRMRVTLLDATGPVTISSQIINRQDGGSEYGAAGRASGVDPRRAQRITNRVLLPAERGEHDGRLTMSYRVAASAMTVAVAVDHVMTTANEFERVSDVQEDMAKSVFTVRAEQGVPISLTKVVSYHTSRGAPTRELIDRCCLTLDRVASTGIEEEFAKQVRWLDAYWHRSDVVVEGDEPLQQAIRWNLFQLAQAAARADGLGVPAKGVTGSGYSGHYFWDTEVYVLPFLAYTSPLWARNVLRQREQMLPLARKRARMLNEDGALFPWRTINGEEASAYYAAGTAQYHINADITYALAKFVWATGDIGFLANGAVDIAVETARMWTTLGFWRNGGEHTFHIHGVTGPDEYTTVVNDNLFTNVMAKFNLRYAVEVVESLQESSPDKYRLMVDRLSLREDEVAEWTRVAEAMSIPYSEALGIHPQDSHFLEREIWDLPNTPEDRKPLLLHYHPLVIYRFQVLKQADVVLALFLQGDRFTAEEKRLDFEYYDPLTTGDSTLSGVVQAIMAAEIGYQDLALDYFKRATFVDLANLHNNTADGVHVANAGGVWSSLVSGFGGMRDHGGRMQFDPRLPVEWQALEFPLIVHGTRFTVRITPDEFRARIVEGTGPVEFTVRGEPVRLRPGADAVVVLHGQGPRIPGAPKLDTHLIDDEGQRIPVSLPTVTASIPIIQLDETLQSLPVDDTRT